MPIIHHDDLTTTEIGPGLHSREIAGPDNGAENLTVREVTLDPGAAIPLHIHPTHQECIVILEGEVEGRLADEVRQLGPGNTILAPTAVKHNLVNRGQGPARILAIFPTSQVTRELVS